MRTLKFQPPEPGKDIYLNIDIRLQLKAQELLAGRRGAIVMMDPNTGAILAMESSPSYDPNLFVTGISSANYSALLNDPARPLVNRTTQGIYAPASTVKPMMAVMGLNEGPSPPTTATSAAPASPSLAPPRSFATGAAGVTAGSTSTAPSKCRRIPTSTISPTGSASTRSTAT